MTTCMFALYFVKSQVVLTRFLVSHRIGRTGRAGRTGTAYSYVTVDQGKLASELVRILQDAKQNIPNELWEIASSGRELLFALR